ncbi:bidirectional sugar transporter SWEET5 [Selaginella moellendorffii]|uniref:bidirectional sugar transporter SWEET5 n=1 Tax=Selaginella moellendorffii TaxID=88036 RepID=UPI000D1CCA51|nr:bidirectional sugar transporter SWEET5 [Selaginella moellendorffii]|eukprot:XP_024530732.1 bidirectional sugar transporter SWEET5 [Selaginella moellendorffii]
MGVADTIIGICGNIAALVLFLVPAKTFNTIRKKKSTLDFSGIPYVTTLLNCLLWVLYGLPVNKGNVLVMTINSSGIVIQTVYILLFLYYASSWAARRKILGIFVFDIVATAALGAGVILGVHSKATRITILGISCVVLNIGMYYAPLSVMWLVIKTKSNEYMPFLLSLMVLINSSFWTIYAFLLMDIYIIIFCFFLAARAPMADQAQTQQTSAHLRQAGPGRLVAAWKGRRRGSHSAVQRGAWRARSSRKTLTGGQPRMIRPP